MLSLENIIEILNPPRSYQVIHISDLNDIYLVADTIIYGFEKKQDIVKAASFIYPQISSKERIYVIKNKQKKEVNVKNLETEGDIEAVFVPKTDIKSQFEKLISVISRLRSPDGCPWDLEQTLKTIKGHLIEEAYEVVDTINRNDYEHLKEELGDLMLQVVLYAQMSAQSGEFTINDVLKDINDKLIRRHPHVFAEGKATQPKEVIAEWERIKKKEKDKASYMEGVPKGLPSLVFAQKLQSKAARVGFDWVKPEDVIDKIDEEVEELKKAKNLSWEEQESELGDILFAIVNYSRKLEIDAESALLSSSDKFKKRFQKMEDLAKKKNKDFTVLSLEDKEKLWEEVKKAGS